MNRKLLSIAALAAALAAPSAFANNVSVNEWHRATGGVAPQVQAEDLYARGTGGVAPQAEGDDFYSRGTGGVAPQAERDDFYARGTGGVPPQVNAE